MDYSLGVLRSDSLELYEGLSAVFKTIRTVAEREYATFDMGSAQAKILRNIGQKAASSQAEVARATGIAPTLTGRALEPLIAKGWVRRKRSELDRREYLLQLTASGQRMRDRVEQARERLVERVSAALDARDRRDFQRIAKRILAALES